MELNDMIKTALRESVHEAMTTLFSMTPQITEMELDLSREYTLICSLGMVGRVEGNILITFTGEHACCIVAKMLDMEIRGFTPDVSDGVCEFLNMIGGGMKTRLAVLNHDFDINIPLVVEGNSLNFFQRKDMSVIHTGFTCKDFGFETIVIFKLHEEGTQPKKQALPKSNVDTAGMLNRLIKDDSPNA